eukprot:scaffold126150_cov60-Attheya_sp.AAC.20
MFSCFTLNLNYGQPEFSPLVRLVFVAFTSISILSHQGGAINQNIGTTGRVLSFEHDFHAKPNDKSPEAQLLNREVLSSALQFNVSDNTLVIPQGQIFYLRHGVFAQGLQNAVMEIDGSLVFERDKRIPLAQEDYDEHGRWPSACIHLEDAHNVTITSSGDERGVIDGGGPAWWGRPFFGYRKTQEHRPPLLVVNRSTNLLIEKLVFRDPPLYTMFLRGLDGMTIRYVSIVARRTRADGHRLVDMSAFNTDGIDVSGHNVHVHDVDIWNQDDCIAVKDNYSRDKVSSNMTFERINASGLGLTIGSIGSTTVRNVTFKDSYLYESYKGIYLKFRTPKNEGSIDEDLHGKIEDILFSNITLESPQQWAIWIGPAQQAISSNICTPNPCSLCWPTLPGTECNAVETGIFRNITLRDIVIRNPKGSPGVIMGHENNPIQGLVFDNVEVIRGYDRHINRYETFPGLKQPVHDHIAFIFKKRAHIFRNILGIILSLVIVFRICFFYRNIFYSILEENDSFDEGSEDQNIDIKGNSSLQQRAGRHRTPSSRLPVQWKQTRKWIYRTLMAATAIMIFMMVTWFTRNTMKRLNTDEYFECSEVANGIALGRTWPIPYCFENGTSAYKRQTKWQGIAMGSFFVIIMACSFAMWKIGIDHQRQFVARHLAKCYTFNGTTRHHQVRPHNELNHTRPRSRLFSEETERTCSSEILDGDSLEDDNEYMDPLGSPQGSASLSNTDLDRVSEYDITEFENIELVCR